MTLKTVDRCLPSVLIVDDEASVRSLLRSMLESTARVHEAEDAERALKILETQAPATDLVLVDQFLPRLTGLEVLQVTKRNWPWIPVAIVTGFGSEDLAVQALRAGASDYLRKPIELAALLRMVARLIRKVQCPVTSPVPGVGIEDSVRPIHPSIRRALAFMSEHFAEAITLAEVASEADLSRFHFCRLFHQEMGVPFHEHLHRLRLRRATTLLGDRSLKVSEIAYAVGFTDLSHFDRTFRRILGRSPSEYRALT
jgi:two-component system response regulator YesN